MNIFNKPLNNYAFDTTLGVSVQDIKCDWHGDKDEKPNISVLTRSYSYPDGVKKAHLNIRVIADVKLTRRSKVKKVMIIIPFDQTAMEEIINKLKETK